jgi:phosphate-selective porin
VQTASSGGSTLIEISRKNQSVQGVSPSLFRLLKQATVALVLGLSATTAPAEDVSGSEVTVESAAAETSILEDLEQRLANQERELETLRQDRVRATYRKGFLFEAVDQDSLPFALQVNGRMQGRYTGFSGSGTGQVSRNHFEIERGRLEFRGQMYDPKLRYFMNLDADTDDNHDVKFHDFWVNYDFDKSFRLYFGKQKVASGEIWLQASTNMRFADRDVATTFFKADRTVGLRADGVWGAQDEHYYQFLVGNGNRSTDLTAGNVDDIFLFSLIHWTDLFGPLGPGLARGPGPEDRTVAGVRQPE